MVNISDIKNSAEVFQDSIKYYFKHFLTLTKYMAFPVLGQFLGIIVISITTAIFISILPNLIEKYEFFQIPRNVFLTSVVVTIPGLAILFRAFWRYLASYGTISSMAYNLNKSGTIYDMEAHDEVINRAIPQYILLWLLFSLFCLVGIIPFFWVPAIILYPFFILIFQVFTFNEINHNNGKAIDAFKQSFNMIKGHYFATFLLFALHASFCTFIQMLIPMIVDNINLGQIILNLLNIQPNTILVEVLRISALNATNMLIGTVLCTIIIMFTLPLRAITWTLWYKKLAPIYHREQRKAKKSNVVKLDKRILDRAMEDYE